MDGNGLDFSKILKMVTDNPTMLQTAISLAGKLKDTAGTDTTKSTVSPSESAPATAPVPVLSPNNISRHSREDERNFLVALRPYLNETRREKIDFILKILQLLELAGTLGLTFDQKSKGGDTSDV